MGGISRRYLKTCTEERERMKRWKKLIKKILKFSQATARQFFKLQGPIMVQRDELRKAYI